MIFGFQNVEGPTGTRKGGSKVDRTFNVLEKYNVIVGAVPGRLCEAERWGSWDSIQCTSYAAWKSGGKCWKARSELPWCSWEKNNGLFETLQ